MIWAETTTRESLLWVVLGVGGKEVENIRWHVCENFAIKFDSNCRDLVVLLKQVDTAKKPGILAFLCCFSI